MHACTHSSLPSDLWSCAFAQAQHVCVSVCMCVCVCVITQTHTHIRTHTQTHTQTYTHTRTPTGLVGEAVTRRIPVNVTSATKHPLFLKEVSLHSSISPSTSASLSLTHTHTPTLSHTNTHTIINTLNTHRWTSDQSDTNPRTL